MDKKQSPEIWRDISGYEGEYQISTEGRVKSLKRQVRCRNGYRTIQERILSPGRYSKSGHLSVILRKGSNGKPVHQLVAYTFLGAVPEGMEVLHNNGNPQDNRLCNLRYGTRTENILDVYKQGKRWRKLSIEDVYNVRFFLLCGFSGNETGRQLGISAETISKIKSRRSYAWLR